MDPFEKKISEILESRKKVAETIVKESEKINEVDDTKLPYNIYKTTKHIDTGVKKALKPLTRSE